MTDIHDVQRLEQLEQEIKDHTLSLNAELAKKRDIDIESLKVETNIQVLKNSLRQILGERDSLKKILTILPRS